MKDNGDGSGFGYGSGYLVLSPVRGDVGSHLGLRCSRGEWS